jgi:neuroligin
MGTGFHDQLAALHWLQENIASFGGDPARITAMGHDTGAALVHYLLMSKITKGIIRRAILLSGAAVCPWAFVADPLETKQKVSEALNCTVAKYDRDDVAPCVRKQPLGSLLTVDVPRPRSERPHNGSSKINGQI